MNVFRAMTRGIVSDDVLGRKDKIGFSSPERDRLLGMTSAREDCCSSLEISHFSKRSAC